MNIFYRVFAFFLMMHIGFIPTLNASSQSGSMFSVVSWNILGPNTQDAGSFFTLGDYKRIDRIIYRIKTQVNGKFGPSIICLQEVDARSRSIIQKAFAHDYTEVIYRAKGVHGGVILLVKKSEFNVIDQKGITLPDGGAAAIGLIKSLKSGAVFMVSSLHLSRSNHKSISNMISGERQLKFLQEAVNSLEKSHNLNSKKVHKIYAGDYNTDVKEFTNSTLCFLSSNDKNNCFSEVFPAVETVNSATGNRKGIDHIAFSDNLKITNYSKVIGNMPGTDIHKQVESDHAVLYAVWFLK